MDQLTEEESNILQHILTQIMMRPNAFNHLLVPSGTPDGLEKDYSKFAGIILQKLGLLVIPTKMPI